MTNVLVVDDDPLFRRLVVKMLQQAGSVAVQEAGGVEHAKRQLRQRASERQPVDVLITDLQMRDGDGLDLIELLPELSPGTMPILMSGVASPRDYQSALRLGAIDLLVKPFPREALALALQRAKDSATGFRGSFHGLSLADLLQMFHLARRSLVLEIRGTRHRGLIVFEGGEMIHAEAGEARGKEALGRFLAMTVGSLATTPFRPTARSLTGDFQGLLLDSFRELDEENHQGKQALEDVPELELEEIDEELEALDGEDGDAERGVPGEPAPGGLLASFAGSLDPELGVASLGGGRLEVLQPGRFSPQEWGSLGEQAAWLAGQLQGGWRQVQWSVGALGLAICAPPGVNKVLLAQKFSGDLDDRRFRWNVSCVNRYLLDASEGAPS
jgi:CheY-like chemotaxis protein